MRHTALGAARIAAAFSFAAFAALYFLPLHAAQKADAPIIVEEIIVERSPSGEVIGAETLCTLRVKLRNNGTQKAYGFVFDVKIDGRASPLYEKLAFMVSVDPGATRLIPLNNFNSTDPGSTVPRDGKLSVEVVLKQAQWVEIKKEKENEVWTPLGEVRGLPSSKSITKQIQTAAK